MTQAPPENAYDYKFEAETQALSILDQLSFALFEKFKDDPWELVGAYVKDGHAEDQMYDFITRGSHKSLFKITDMKGNVLREENDDDMHKKTKGETR